MAPSPRAAFALALTSTLFLIFPPSIGLLLLLAVITTTIVDGVVARSATSIERSLPKVMSRGVPAPFRVSIEASDAKVRVRQGQIPDVHFEPQEADGPELEGVALPLRRWRHAIPGPAARRDGPLGMGRWFHGTQEAQQEVLVYPDLPAARRIAIAVREGRFAEPGRITRGPLGLGTQFESIRDYLPDDDIRQVNWRATSRMGRPMSNQYRVEQDRDVMCVVDSGRLMRAPLGPDRTRLDAALDATVAIALTTDVVGDRCGTIAFD
ncbi:MAG: hypothetical protein QOH90_1286, partial [Actinomycetota bacterium]|nr:hypothetical protein [Actinomycetota bacterium]